MRLKLASRKSDLARWQAVQVAKAIEGAGAHIEYIFKSSFGDQNLDLPLAGMGARGVFTEDFYKDLTDGRCDLVVHSWKDLPIEERDNTRIAMTLARADIRDVLLIPEDVWQRAIKKKSLTVLTSSPRRIYNLTPVLPKLLPGSLHLEFRNVRGNVATRLSKMHSEDAGLVLAKAGLDRLLEAEQQNFVEDSIRERIKNCRVVVLPISVNPPAPAQGALAVEIARDHQNMTELCRQLNDKVTYQSVQAEREVLQRYGGGCHQKIGVARLPRPYGMVCALRGLTEAGEVLQDWRIENSTPWTKAKSAHAIFPQQAKHNTWFRREALSVTKEQMRAPRAFFVARAEAWPSSHVPEATQLLWTAGLQTWFKLAAKGLFVNGCQDGLGENETIGLDLIAGPREWCKLSHQTAPGTALATYRLNDHDAAPDLTGCTHFFWMSRTSFERALALFPKQVLAGYNACGPGHTHDFLKTRTDLRHPVKVFMGLEQFLKESLP